MNRPSTSLGPAYFEEIFLKDEDPWDLETSPYERDKYAHSIRTLGGRIYANGFEVGCARGVLTEALARRCLSLLAIDVSATALQAAHNRCSPQDHVAFSNMAFPGLAPARIFDLIVLSEVAYYWADHDLHRAGDWLTSHLAPGGDLLMVHWTGETDYPQSGDEAVNKLRNVLGNEVKVMTAERRAHYRLDLWRRHA